MCTNTLICRFLMFTNIEILIEIIKNTEILFELFENTEILFEMFTNIEMLTNTELLLEMFTIPLPLARSFSLLDQPSLAFLSPVFILMVSVLECAHLTIKHISQAYFVKTIFNIETHIMREKTGLRKVY